jgi:hypothetical protein
MTWLRGEIGVLLQEDLSDSEFSSEQSTMSEQSASSPNTNTNLVAAQQNNLSTEGSNDPPSPSPVVNSENVEETLFLPVGCTPILAVLSLCYNWYKMGLLYPLFYNLQNQFRVLYSYLIDR